MPPISIMHVVLEPRYSGAEILVRDLIRAQSSRGHRTGLIALRPSQASFEKEIADLQRRGCQIFLPQIATEKLQRVAWIRRAIKSFKPHIVFSHSVLPNAYTRLALYTSRSPVVVSVLHTDDDYELKWARNLERFLWRRHASVVGVSEEGPANYLRRINKPVPTRVIQNGIWLDTFKAAAKQGSKWKESLYKPSTGEIIILQVGRVSWQKQQKVSVQAIALLKERGIQNVRLVFAGLAERDSYEELVRETVRTSGVQDQVQFLGPRGDIAELMAGADIHLMPSSWEAHSIAALEALASGSFNIFTDIQAFQSFKNFPGVSFVPEKVDAIHIADTIEESLRLRTYTTRFDRDLTLFSVDRCADEYEQLIQKLLPNMK